MICSNVPPGLEPSKSPAFPGVNAGAIFDGPSGANVFSVQTSCQAAPPLATEGLGEVQDSHGIPLNPPLVRGDAKHVPRGRSGEFRPASVARQRRGSTMPYRI